MRRNGWTLQEEENGGTGSGGGGGGVDAATARTFLTDFVHDPEMVKTLPDEKVIEWHGKINAGIDKVRPAAGKWPEKWRDELAGGDDKALKQLERYGSPADVWKKARALEQRVTSGELRASVPFPEKGTDEEKNAWRKEQGVPEAPEKYELKLPEGFVIGEADKPLVDDFLKSAHAANMKPGDVNQAVNWFFQNRDKQLAAEKDAQAKIEKETEDDLRGEWGTDYRKHEALIDGLLAETMADEDLRNDLASARKLNPALAKWMLGVAMQLNPAGTVVPGGSQQAANTRLAEIRNILKTDKARYDADPNMRKEFEALVAQEARLKQKAA